MSILTQALERLGRIARAALANSCLLCGGDGDDLLCTGCVADLPGMPPEACPRCAQPSPGGKACGACLKKPPHFDSATALYCYEFPVDSLVHALKYGGRLPLAAWFGSRLAEALAGADFDRIIPLPLHPDRLAGRGFNQSAEIGRGLGRRLGVPLDIESCRRLRPTAPQADLPLAERAANVRGAFECSADLSGRRILLIDDVMTSGETLSECARTLKLHGAEEVSAAVIARALRN